MAIFTILSISFVLSYIFSLKQVYQLQVCEYRLDRFRVMLGDSGISNFFLPKVIAPANTTRNILISFTSFVIFLGLNYVFFVFFKENLTAIISLSIMNYLFAKFVVIFSSLLTRPVANFYRKKTILQAKEKIENSSTVMIGVTGSFGKSSVKEFLYKILKEKYCVERTKGNRNTDIGVALEINEKLNENLDYFVCEMGAYKRGEIKAICDFVSPQYAILTAIGNQHMGIFRSIENLVRAKSELLESLPEDGFGVLNIDHSYKDKVLQFTKSRIATYGWDKKADYRITNVSYKGRLMFVEFTGLGKQYKFTTALLGEHQAINLLGVIALALELKVSYEIIQKAIAKLQPIENKLSLHLGVNEIVVLNDGYNSNLDGFLAGLEIAKKFDATKKYVFSYGMFELGKEKKDAYKKVIHSITEGNLTLLTLDKKFYNLNPDSVLYFKNESDVIEYISRNLNKGDLFMLEGRCTQDFLTFLDLKAYEV